MNFGTWKISVNKKDQLEFYHKNLNNGEYEIVKKYKPPLKHKLKKLKLKKLKLKKHKLNKLNKDNEN